MTSQDNAITLQVQSMTAQMNRQVGPRVPHHANTMPLHMREFTKTNPPMYFRSRADEDPQYFLDEVYKNYAICLTSIEKAELAGYQLKYVAQTWYVQWRDNRTLRCGSVSWEIFKKAFLDWFFPKEMMEVSMEEFINLRQGCMSARDDRVYNPKSQKGRGISSSREKPTCGKYGKKHCGDCLVGTKNRFSCGNRDHNIRYCPTVKGQDKGSGQDEVSCSNVDAPKKNHFYALRSRGEKVSRWLQRGDELVG
ncbi:hypothetical protein EJD97_022372 [Solanum chilense]|uniref:Retrotransposon gag domain-containing protein n=1 Tax=Solanum chilense TaxID=4083 RepID=A0A6N2C3F3_SOLCI|nr:hypothetical protein EJD97_022372 [Solanum chilense]